MKKLTLLGDITPAQFLRDYWHKKPLLIRQAVPGFKPLLDFKALSELAKLDHVESRLVSQVDGRFVGRTRIDSDGLRARPLVVGDWLYAYGNGGNLVALTIK